MRRILAAAASALVLIGSCSGPSDNPTTSAERFMHALAAGDIDHACRLVATDEQPVSEDHDWEQCQSFLHLALASAGDEVAKYAQAKVTSAGLDGDAAHVANDDIAGVLDPDFELDLIRIDGRWYVDDIG